MKEIVFFHNKIRPNDNEMNIYKEILNFNSIPFKVYNSGNIEFVKDLNDCYFIFKWGHDHHSRQLAETILPVMELSGIKCFPNYNTAWHYDDKVKQYFLLSKNGFPVVPSYVFYDKHEALNWVETECSFPTVFKLKGGAGSLSVFLIKDKKQAIRKINQLFGMGISQNELNIRQTINTLNYDLKKIIKFYAIGIRNRYLTKDKNAYWLKHKNYAYFQEFMPGNEWDTRVTTAGLRAHAFRRFTRPGDFRASGSNRWDISPENIDIRMVRIALDVSAYFGFQAMAYDFVYDPKGEPKIVEMSYLYGGAGYPDFMNGYWDNNLIWHEGRFWPQFFELMDFLELPDLKLPKLDSDTGYKKATII